MSKEAGKWLQSSARGNAVEQLYGWAACCIGGHEPPRWASSIIHGAVQGVTVIVAFVLIADSPVSLDLASFRRKSRRIPSSRPARLFVFFSVSREFLNISSVWWKHRFLDTYIIVDTPVVSCTLGIFHIYPERKRYLNIYSRVMKYIFQYFLQDNVYKSAFSHSRSWQIHADVISTHLICRDDVWRVHSLERAKVAVYSTQNAFAACCPYLEANVFASVTPRYLPHCYSYGTPGQSIFLLNLVCLSTDSRVPDRLRLRTYSHLFIRIRSAPRLLTENLREIPRLSTFAGEKTICLNQSAEIADRPDRSQLALLRKNCRQQKGTWIKRKLRYCKGYGEREGKLVTIKIGREIRRPSRDLWQMGQKSVSLHGDYWNSSSMESRELWREDDEFIVNDGSQRFRRIIYNYRDIDISLSISGIYILWACLMLTQRCECW